MCLTVVYRGKEKRSALESFPEKICCWKVVKKQEDKSYATDIFRHPLVGGLNKFNQNIITNGWVSYKGGTHLFVHKINAERWASTSEKVARIKVRKKDINAIGKLDHWLVIVAKQAEFPKYIGKPK